MRLKKKKEEEDLSLSFFIITIKKTNSEKQSNKVNAS